MGYLIGFIVVFALIFLWMYYSGSETEHTKERAKISLGCTIMFIAFALYFLVMILGGFKMCSDSLKNDRGPEYDYYDDRI